MTATEVPVFDAEVALECQNTLGEGITWCERTNALYWVDIDEARIHSYDPETGKCGAAHYPETTFVSALAPTRGGQFVAAFESEVVLLDAPAPSSADPRKVVKSSSTKVLAAPLDAEVVAQKLVRFNDGACDANGRFFIGSMMRPEKRDGRILGELWRIEADGSATRILENVGTSNGIDWSPDNKLMYYIDSGKHQVDVFDYDLKTGTPSNRRVFVSEAPAPLDGGEPKGVFDGLIVDGVGNIWVARWGDSRVICFSPEGKPIAQVRTPGARSDTIPCFGGRDLTTLYINTANANLAGQGDIQAQWPRSGDLFKIDCGPETELGKLLGEGWKGRVRHSFRE